MAVPGYQDIMLPLLQYLADGCEHTKQEAESHLIGELELTEAEQRKLLPSGKQTVFSNRLGWARTYLYKAGLIDSPARGVMRINQRGRDLLAEKPSCITTSVLDRYPEFQEFLSPKKKRVEDPTKCKPDEQSTPEEMLESAYQDLREQIEADLLQQVKSASAAFFERLVVELLVAMGYGGTLKDAGEAVGRSGDGGIDGIIKEDQLGLDVIYVQAKKWENTVGRPEVQKFAGALHGNRARKGVFLTTGSFSQGAIDYAANIDTKIILIDGTKLASLMVDHNVGAYPVSSYEVKKVDLDFFIED